MKAPNEGFAIAPTLGYYGTSSLILTSKEGPNLGIPAELDIEFQPESKPLTVDQLPSQLKSLLTPTITAQPLLAKGRTLTVSATGIGDLMYQWFKNGVAISGATLSTFSAGTNSGSYSVKVSNAVLGVQTQSVFVSPEETFSGTANTIVKSTVGLSTAVSKSGKLWVWGNNPNQIGVSVATANNKLIKNPTQLCADSDWKFVFSNFTKSYTSEGSQVSNFGVKFDGSLWAWGLNGSDSDWGGVLGTNTLEEVITVPRKIASGSWIAVYGTAAPSSSGPSGGYIGIKSDGTLWNWGNNKEWNSTTQSSGQYNGWVSLPEGKKVIRIPTQVGTDSDWLKLYYPQIYYNLYNAGADRYFAIKKNGTLWACGSNKRDVNSDVSYLGLGDTDVLSAYFPTQVGTDSDWKEIYPSENNVLALKNDGSLWAWGANGLYLGTGSDQSFVKKPERIGSDNDWLNVWNFEYSYYAQKSDGSLWAWGNNYNGKLGVGDTSWAIPVPMRVSLSSNSWKFFTSNWGYIFFAIKSDGTLWSWGSWSDPLGRNSDFPANTPTQIGVDTDWDSVVTSGEMTFAIKRNGTLWAWGYNNIFNNIVQGNLGVPQVNGSWDYIVRTPTQIGTDSDWDRVLPFVSSSQRTYAVKKDGTLWAWGENGLGNAERGALGVGSNDGTVSVPTKMTFE
jgi:alpha-tubulin suppressor-like RCC1 family protein